MASFSEFKNLSELEWFEALPEDVQSERELNNLLISIEGKDHLIAEVTLAQFDWTVYLISPLGERQTQISHGFIFSIVTLLIIVFSLFVLIYNLLYYFRKDMQPELIIRDISELPDKHHISATYERLIGQNESISVILLSIDNFSQITDRYGRSLGDDLLQKVSVYLLEQMERNQVLGRWGRGEYIVLLPNMGPNEAGKLANNFRHGIATLPTKKDHVDLLLTASFGVSFSGSARPLTEVTAHAEDALYQARREGQNQVCVQLID